MANTVTFQIKIEGSGEIKNVTVNAQELGKAFDAVQAEVKGLKSELVSLSSAIQVMDGFSSAIGQIQNIFSGLSAAYTAQESAETRLAQAMRNTMNASDEQIQSIKNLAAAQQQLGIVGDEVQLAAAQELATYLQLPASLESIIPVMNDMIAQQLGFGASAESATQIATMLGKVMNGQTEALSRYGYKFDEAQKYILKYGDESERAAVLAEVVEESVGGMNAAMAQTPTGRMQQTANAIGDIKEKLGAAVQGAMPLISALAEISMAATGILKLTTTIQALGNTTAVARLKTVGLAAAQRMQSLAARMLGISELQAATATGVLRAQIIALQATMTLGLAAAITFVIDKLSKLIGSSEKAESAIANTGKAQDAYREAAGKARAEVTADIVALEDLIKHKGREGEKVAELNRKYGDAFGTYSTAADWYDILTSKSKDYCQQLAYEAMAAGYKDELADAIKRQSEAEKRRDNTRKVVGYTEGKGTYLDAYGVQREGLVRKDVINPDWQAADNDYNTATEDIERLSAEMADALKKANDLAAAIKGSGEAAATSWKDMNLADLEKAIKDQRALVEGLAGSGKSDKARSEAATLKQMEARAKALKAQYGLDSSSGGSKDKYDGSELIENASTYKELGNNIKFYQNALESANAADTEAIRTYAAKIASLEAQQKAIKAVQDDVAVPADPKTLEEIDKAILYQQSLRRKASKDSIAYIDAEIQHLEGLKTVMEENAHVELSNDQIKTYKQLEDEISFYSAKLQNAGETDRASIQKRILELRELKEAWDETLAAMDTPGDIGTLNSIDDLDKAISYWQSRQNKASADEVAGIQATILALQQKRKAIEGISSIPEYQMEISGLDGLSGKQLKMELELIGLDGVKDKIRSLQKMLDDTKNPLDSTQRAQVEQLIASYSSYQKILQKSNVSVTEGWNNIKGMTGSIQSLTETLQGDGSAWEKVSAVIDGTLSLYEGMKGVIDIIQMLTTVTNAHTIAKKAQGDEELIAAGKTAAAAGTDIAASEAVTVAKTTEASAKTLDAGAGAASAVSSIPVVGPILAVAAIASVIAAIMAIPKFADGGIAYGPTLGLFGEYAGAGNNPEVVAPLDKLRSLIGTSAGISGDVNFRIRGRDLVGIFENEQNRARR